MLVQSFVNGHTLLSFLVQVTCSPPPPGSEYPAFDQITVAVTDTVESDSEARSADDAASSQTIVHCRV